MITDLYTGQHDRTSSDPNVVAHHHGAVDDGLVDDIGQRVMVKLIGLGVDDDAGSYRATGAYGEPTLTIKHAELVDVGASTDRKETMLAGGVQVGIAEQADLGAEAEARERAHELDISADPQLRARVWQAGAENETTEPSLDAGALEAGDCRCQLAR